IIYMLRKALGNEANEGKYIETIPKRGYRFVAEVRKIIEEASAEPEIPGASAPTLSEAHDPFSLLFSSSSSLHFPAFLPQPLRRRPGLTLLAALGLAIALSAAFYWVWGLHLRFAAERAAIASAPVQSVAVLPFRVLSAEKDDEYLSLGLADALITS